MIAMTPDAQRCLAAKAHSSKHRAEVEASARCGCFFCFRQFAPTAIKAWTESNQTALCPNCGMDAVIGNASPYQLDDKFLRRMHGQFFSYRTK
jgi:hypothetical protein